ncbi:MAG TPA: hypothetical protein VIY52_34150 [Streptosporangiaceae bacterium]
MDKPRRLPSTRRAVTDDRLAEICQAAADGGDDPELDTLLLRLHTFPHARAIRLTPTDDPGAAASQSVPSVRSGPSPPPAEPPAITRTDAERILVHYWRVNNAANQSRSEALLATIEAGSSYAMDAGAYQMSRVTDPSNSQYAPFTAKNAVYYIPRQPAGVYPRWFATRITYATLASPQHVTGAGYVLFVQDSKDAAWKNVLEPYLLSSAGPAPFIEIDSQGYAIQATLTSAARLTAAPAQIPQLTAQSLDGGSAALKNPGNLADLRDQAYFQVRLPAGSAVTDQHGTSGLVFALKTVSGGALVFYHLTTRLTLTPPPGQTIQLCTSATTRAGRSSSGPTSSRTISAVTAPPVMPWLPGDLGFRRSGPAQSARRSAGPHPDPVPPPIPSALAPGHSGSG